MRDTAQARVTVKTSPPGMRSGGIPPNRPARSRHRVYVGRYPGCLFGMINYVSKA